MKWKEALLQSYVADLKGKRGTGGTGMCECREVAHMDIAKGEWFCERCGQRTDRCRCGA